MCLQRLPRAASGPWDWLAGVARQKDNDFTVYAQSQEGDLLIITVYTCQQQQQSEKFTISILNPTNVSCRPKNLEFLT
jgi:hypothetical protein